jgi:FtsP/CotA-like multicopper oxidase with cupredoxin domain
MRRPRPRAEHEGMTDRMPTRVLLIGLVVALTVPGVLRHCRGKESAAQSGSTSIESALPRATEQIPQVPRALAQALPLRREGNVGTLAFENELRVPPLLAPRRDDAGRTVFDLRLRRGTSKLLPGKTTETWGVNGTYLGPTLRASGGDRVLVRVRNDLPDATTMHWHGMQLPAVADGGPHQVIAPGSTWSPGWSIEQPAATLWYHPHPHGETADHVYRGLAGMFIVDDPESTKLALPKTYGVDDIPLIIEDKRFHRDGSLDLSQPFISPTGRLGNRILVNGTYDPHLNVAHERIRFRLLNASGARVYNLGFADDRQFDLIATDGGFMETPERVSRIQLSPGERAEIVAAFPPGGRAVLRSFEPELGTNFVLDRLTGGDDTFDLIEVRAAAKLAHSPHVTRRLAPHPHAHPEDATRTRRFELSDELEINGKQMDMSRIDEVVEAGSSEIWEVRNASQLPHNFHVHGIRFRVIEYAGDAPPVHLTGPKDTVFLPPSAAVRIVARFGEDADPRTPYMFHCHLLWHEDHGMMGQFTVVGAGQIAPLPGNDHHGRRAHEGPRLARSTGPKRAERRFDSVIGNG